MARGKNKRRKAAREQRALEEQAVLIAVRIVTWNDDRSEVNDIVEYDLDEVRTPSGGWRAAFLRDLDEKMFKGAGRCYVQGVRGLPD
jgi:hypothetical protein